MRLFRKEWGIVSNSFALGFIVLIFLFFYWVFTADYSEEPKSQKVGVSNQIATGSGNVVTLGKEYKVGDMVKVLDRELTVNSVERVKYISYYTAGEEKEYIIVNLTIKNVGNEEFDFWSGDFKVQDENGVQRDSATASYGLDDYLESGDLAPNGIVTGSIAFKVPEGDRVKLIFIPDIFLKEHRAVFGL